MKYQFKGILGKMSTKYLDIIVWSESVWRCLGWCYKKSDQLQEEMSDSYFSNSIRRSCWMGMWAGKINSGEANNAGDRWVLFAILLTLAGKKGPRLNRLWFQSLGRHQPWIEICKNSQISCRESQKYSFKNKEIYLKRGSPVHKFTLEFPHISNCSDENHNGEISTCWSWRDNLHISSFCLPCALSVKPLCQKPVSQF